MDDYMWTEPEGYFMYSEILLALFCWNNQNKRPNLPFKAKHCFDDQMQQKCLNVVTKLCNSNSIIWAAKNNGNGQYLSWRKRQI